MIRAGSYVRSALGALLMAATFSAAAATPYPTQPVRIFVGFSAGGAVDAVARQIGQALASDLNQSFVVENRAGATGTIAADAVAKAAPDGYSLLVATQSTMIVAPRMYPRLSFSPQQDFAPIALIASVPLALVAHPSVPVKTVEDVVALARDKRGELVYASSGLGGPQHLAAELFATMAGVKMVHVPYKGEANAISDLLGNHVPLMFSNLPTLLPHIQSGQLRGIAVSGLSRSTSAPDLPTVDESGLPGFEAQTWFALFAPAGTPAEVVSTLEASVLRSLEDPALREKLAAQGLTVTGLGASALARTMQDESVKLGGLVEKAGLKPE